MKHSIILGTLVAGLALTGSLYGHHAAAGIDRSKTVSIEGTVKRFNWANPHSYLEIEVPNAKEGTWTYTVTNLHLPYENFPFTVTVVSETVELFTEPARAKGLSLSCVFEEGLRTKVVGEPHWKCRQIHGIGKCDGDRAEGSGSGWKV